MPSIFSEDLDQMLKMEPPVFDSIKFEKERAVARFNRFRRISHFRQVAEVLLVLGLVSWSSARVPAALRSAGEFFIHCSACLCSHHAVFLIGNAIIFALFVLCRRNDVAGISGGVDFYDEYVRNREPAVAAVHHQCEVAEEKRIVLFAEEVEIPPPQLDDATEAIRKAARRIEKFQRTQSEKLRRDIAVRQEAKLRRSETNPRRRIDAAEIERMSSEDFRQAVDAFIEKNWCKKKQQSEVGGEEYQQTKIATSRN